MQVSAFIPLILFALGLVLWLIVFSPPPSASKWAEVARCLMWAGLFAFAFSVAGQVAGCTTGGNTAPASHLTR